jgi:hypothetical protein
MADDQIRLGGANSNKQNPGQEIPGRENKGTSIPTNQPEETPVEQPTEKTQQDIAKEYNIPEEFLDVEFQVPTEEVTLPSGGAFYPNRKKAVTIKYLTAEEDDILYSPELIKSGRVLDVLLDKAVMDKDLRPEDMISGDRNFLLIEMRKTGLGSDYIPGEITCSSCREVHEPTINLDLIKSKPLKIEPDVNGEYDLLLPIMKMNIKFRLLNGRDEKRLSKLSEVKGKKTGGIKVKKLVTEKYIMQIMEVNNNRDKLYIKKFIAAMPMKDSMFFREYLRRIEPGLDLSYKFECPNCGEYDIKDIPVTPKLFYPDLD